MLNVSKIIQVVEYAIEYETIPLHITDKLLPLDVSEFGPFKIFLSGALYNHAFMYPNKHITTFHLLPELVSEALTRAATPSLFLIVPGRLASD